jgi:hypothetical protein
MAEAPRVVVIDSIDPQMRAYLIGALGQPIAVTPPAPNRGRMWGVLLAIAGLAAYALRSAMLEGGDGIQFYSPFAFGGAACVAYLVGVLFISGHRRAKSLRRLPQQGTFAVGTNLVVATEHTHTVYSFADLERLEVVSQESRHGGLTLLARVAGVTFTFAFADKRRAFDVEQHIHHNITAMDKAFQAADSRTVMQLDPYAYIAASAATPKRPVSGWLVALPVALVSLPISLLVDFLADEAAFEKCKAHPEGRACTLYRHRGGRHEADVKAVICNSFLTSPPPYYDRASVDQMCKDVEGWK